MSSSATYPLRTEHVVSEKVEAIIDDGLGGHGRIGILLLLYDLLQSAVGINHDGDCHLFTRPGGLPFPLYLSDARINIE